MSGRVNMAGIIGVVIGLVVIAATARSPEASAAFPRMIGYSMMVLGALETIRSAVFGPNRAERAEQSGPVATAPAKPALIFTTSTLLYVIALPLIGFYVTTAVYMVALLLALGIRRVGLVAGLPAGLLVLVYLTFTMQLNVPLPDGLLF